ncbi:glycoside hydrolase family 3 C-terminal domain-containing protein [uncultured Draconibacterium sp.]|uniref:beta-glucosidase n=1 Tax=uncultured Draconibacterium sp. TaxID=1573823 RepID=UPI002AA74658|nr:glycoside hydrolase family 3 C-terminal domain-containing protein [uncultured Draconibacterium sp.]
MNTNFLFIISILFIKVVGLAQNVDIDKLVSQLTLEEKALLCAGKGMWQTQEIERLGIPSIFLTDGPHGVRINEGTDFTKPSVKATCFPTASLAASTWDKDLLYKMGQALGDESNHYGVQMLLGPGINIKRSPLGGRNFEYFSEDPIVSGKLASAYINGVQSKGVGTSVKHFAANNQEFERMLTSSEVDERTLREIYLRVFEIVVKEAQPTSVMCAYNKINGIYCTENQWLISDILRNEFGYEGLCVTDWGAVNERVEGIKAGLDLQMPGDGGMNAAKIVEAVKAGSLTEEELNEVVKRNLQLIVNLSENRNIEQTFDEEANHNLARQIASEGMVLLKNDRNVLPIDKTQKQKIAIIGEFAKAPRFQGAGSSLVNPTRLDNFLDAMKQYEDAQFVILYSGGYNKLGETNDSLLNDAVEIAKEADIIIILAGLPDSYESEGFDRETLDMPEGHNKLIERVFEVSNKVVVVLQNGSPVAMPWVENVDGVLEAYLGGQAGGSAIADVLLGEVNPSGKLTETFPKKLSDTPSYLSWPGENRKSIYNEGIFVGYRYYDTKEIEPLFPFGFGLSYTNFEYSGLQVNKEDFTDNENLTIQCKIKNTGKYDGKEVVQLYIKDVESEVLRPVKELKGFEKIYLRQGEEKEVTFKVEPRDFQYYSTKYNSWKADSGEFEILIGSSSQDIRLAKKINLNVTQKYYQTYDINSTIGDLAVHPFGADFVAGIRKMSQSRVSMEGLSEVEKEAAIKQQKMSEASMMEMPLKKVISLSGGRISESMILDLINKMNNVMK